MRYLPSIHFATPTAFLLLVPIALIAFWLARKGRPNAVEYSSADLVRAAAATRRTRWGRFLPALRWLGASLFVVALARPEIVRHGAETRSSGVDVMLAVDVSGSMQARDMATDGEEPESRLEAAKQVVTKFLDQRGSDRVGLVSFAGEPFLASPLTLDHDWVAQSIERLGTEHLEDGTAIGSAIAMGVRRLDAQEAKSKILVLLTDGQSNAGKIDPAASAEIAKALNVKVYTIGVGSSGDALVPTTNDKGQTVLVKARVDVDETAMKDVAEKTGGKFYRATDTDSLRKVYAEIDRLEKTSRTTKIYSERDEHFAWFAIPGLMALLAELGLSATRFRRVP